MVDAEYRHRGIGVSLVHAARDGARVAGLRTPARRLRRRVDSVLHRRLWVQTYRWRPNGAVGLKVGWAASTTLTTQPTVNSGSCTDPRQTPTLGLTPACSLAISD